MTRCHYLLFYTQGWDEGVRDKKKAWEDECTDMCWRHVRMWLCDGGELLSRKAFVEKFVGEILWKLHSRNPFSPLCCITSGDFSRFGISANVWKRFSLSGMFPLWLDKISQYCHLQGHLLVLLNGENSPDIHFRSDCMTVFPQNESDISKNATKSDCALQVFPLNGSCDGNS